MATTMALVKIEISILESDIAPTFPLERNWPSSPLDFNDAT